MRIKFTQCTVYGMAAALAVLAAMGAAGCRRASNAAPSYETAQVARGDLVQYITASGSLEAVVSVDVGSQISGRIYILNADYNSTVRKGDLVAEIDPAPYLAQVHQAEGDLASAKAARELARVTMERKKTLVPLHAATQADLDTAVATLAEDDATITIKEAALENAKVTLGYCKITAPVDGIVIARKVDIGQTVAAAMTTPILFTIAQDITKMHIETSVSEADIGQVKEGQTADFEVDAYPDEVFHGKVAQIRKDAIVTNNVVTYTVIVDVDNPEEKLFPGMTADVSILVARRDHALLVANAALRFVPPEGASYEKAASALAPVLSRSQRTVYLPSGIGPALKVAIVRTGITDGANSEVLEGLREGDRVVTASSVVTEKSGGPFGGPPPPGG
jgi:HlyD family secretion protein